MKQSLTLILVLVCLLTAQNVFSQSLDGNPCPSMTPSFVITSNEQGQRCITFTVSSSGSISSDIMLRINDSVITTDPNGSHSVTYCYDLRCGQSVDVWFECVLDVLGGNGTECGRLYDGCVITIEGLC